MMVVIGIGAPLLSDDGAGLRVIDLLAEIAAADVKLVKSYGGTVSLIEEMAGCSGAVIVDAMIDSNRYPGEVVLMEVKATLQAPSYCSHRESIAAALDFWGRNGVELPAENRIAIVGIVAKEVNCFGERLSPEVENALPEACRQVAACLERLRAETA